MKRLLGYLRPYRRDAVVGPLFKVFEVFFELFVPLVVADLIDNAIPSGNQSAVWGRCLLMVGLGVCGFLCTVAAQYCSAKAATGFAAGVKSAVLAHIQGFSFTQTDKAGTDELMTRLTGDVNQLQTGMNLFLRLFLRSPFIVFGAAVMAFTVDVKSALIFVITIPILSVIVFGIMLLTMPLYHKVQARLAGVLGQTRENLSGTRVIRAFGREADECASFRVKTAALEESQLLAGRLSALMNPLTLIAVNGAMVFLLQSGAVAVDAGRLEAGQVVALVNYLSQILIELVKLANLIITVSKSLSSAGRISEVLAMPSHTEKVGPSPVIDPAVRGSVVFENVSLRYAGAGDDSLSHISFTLPAGSTLGVIGGTGSGKSSLCGLIPHFYEPTDGRVLVNGICTVEYPEAELRREVGTVPQRAMLFRGTVRENLAFGCPDATDGEMLEALRVAQAYDFVMEKPGGLSFTVEDGGRNLSGGQRQRLTIARALVRHPSILILDDSASALDYLTDLSLRRAIASLTPRPTVIIVSQRTASVASADRILVLDDGHAVGYGTHDELLVSCEVYREIYDSQFTGTEATA